VNTAPGTCEFC